MTEMIPLRSDPHCARTGAISLPLSSAGNMEEPAAKPLRRRRQQRSIDTRQKIIQAALAEFAKFGFEGASTRRVAMTVGIPHSLVIHHFNNKSDLWYATVKEAVSWYTQRVYPAQSDPKLSSAASQLRYFFTEYIRFSADHPDFFRMMTQENTLRSERLAWLVENHVRETVRRATRLVKQAQREGALVEGDPTQLLYLFLGAATSPYRSAGEIELLTGQDPATPRRVAEHIKFCERLFFREPD
jgi:TetR/AcrR family transcriptional regulator